MPRKGKRITSEEPAIKPDWIVNTTPVPKQSSNETHVINQVIKVTTPPISPTGGTNNEERDWTLEQICLVAKARIRLLQMVLDRTVRELDELTTLGLRERVEKL